MNNEQWVAESVAIEVWRSQYLTHCVHLWLCMLHKWLTMMSLPISMNLCQITTMATLISSGKLDCDLNIFIHEKQNCSFIYKQYRKKQRINRLNFYNDWLAQFFFCFDKCDLRFCPIKCSNVSTFFFLCTKWNKIVSYRNQYRNDSKRLILMTECTIQWVIVYVLFSIPVSFVRSFVHFLSRFFA